MGELKEFRRGDGVALARFFDTYFPRDPRKVRPLLRSAAYYEWKYGPNPFGDALAFCYWEGDEIIGLSGAVPTPVMIRGENVTAYQSCDAFLAPSFQGRGIHGRTVERLWGEVDRRSKLMYIATPEVLAYNIAAKKHNFYEALTTRRLFGPLRPDECLRLLSANLLMPIGWLAKLSRRLFCRLQPVAVEPLGEIDDRFFADPPPDCDFSIARNPSYVEFRYGSCPEPYVFFRARDDQHDVALVVKFVSWRGLAICYLIDALGRPSVERYDTFLAAALSAIALQGRAAVASVEVPVMEPEIPQLRRAGFFARSRKGLLAVSQNQWPFLNPASSEYDSRRWVFFPGDGDNF